MSPRMSIPMRAAFVALLALPNLAVAQVQPSKPSIESVTSRLSLGRAITVRVELITSSGSSALAFREQAAKLFLEHSISSSKASSTPATAWTVTASRTGIFTLGQIKDLVEPMQSAGSARPGSFKWSLSQTQP